MWSEQVVVTLQKLHKLKLVWGCKHMSVPTVYLSCYSTLWRVKKLNSHFSNAYFAVSIYTETYLVVKDMILKFLAKERY